MMRSISIFHPIIAAFCFLWWSTATPVHAKGSASEERIREAFAESYRLESLQDYTAAVKALEALGRELVYPVYEANLRLGWLCYKAGDHDKSLTYYQRATTLQPLATEPLWGLLLPVTAKEDWVRAESLYKAILKQDHRNARITPRP
jgi:tetratricopeptide (TPR) repeat protein